MVQCRPKKNLPITNRQADFVSQLDICNFSRAVANIHYTYFLAIWDSVLPQPLRVELFAKYHCCIILKQSQRQCIAEVGVESMSNCKKSMQERKKSLVYVKLVFSQRNSLLCWFYGQNVSELQHTDLLPVGPNSTVSSFAVKTLN